MWSTGDSECPIGDPSTAQRIIDSAGVRRLAVLPKVLTVGEVALVGLVEPGLAGFEVDRDPVQPVTLGGVQCGLDGLLARRTDRAGREAGVHIGVVRRLVRALLVAGEQRPGLVVRV